MSGHPIARVLVGLAGTQLGLRLASATTRRVGPVRVRASVEFAPRGSVDIAVPPAGRARVVAYRAPLKVTAMAMDVDADGVRDLIERPRGKAGSVKLRRRLKRAATAAETDARKFGEAFALRAALSGVGGAAALAAVSLRTPRDVVGAAAVGAAALAAAGACAAGTLDTQSWRDPELTGLLAKAPLLLGDLKEAPGKVGRYRAQLADLAATAAAVHGRVVDLPDGPPPDAIRLLHISDIHLSPTAFALVAAAVESFAIDAVVDTGDLVDWGTPAEQAFADQIAALPVPYVFVKGNHDSDAVATAVGHQPNATVLTAQTPPVEIVGLTFAGMADPRFTPDKSTGDDRAMYKIKAAADEFAAGLTHVDVALVHSPNAAKSLRGRASLVLAGDIHRRVTQRYGDTLVLVQGSTGGAGLRGVQTEPPVQLMMSVLFVDRATRVLWGVDEITLGGLGRTEVSIRRKRAAEL